MIASHIEEAGSPFAIPHPALLDCAKFRDPLYTTKGDVRAKVAFERLDTLWINTGTLCNLACKTCYIESSPTNDALIYISSAEADRYFDEAERLGTREIGFTGGEPFMNPDMIAMTASALQRGFDVLILTNAMRPMRRYESQLVALLDEFGARLTLRVSLDHYTQALHEAERGATSWAKAVDGCQWLSDNGFRVAAAGRRLASESEAAARAGYAKLFGRHNLRIDPFDPAMLVLFPEMDDAADVPEISEGCWDVLGISPNAMMCSSSRMVVKHKGASRPSVVACTLLPYDDRFALGETLGGARSAITLNHPHCARFCVLGGASCSG